MCPRLCNTKSGGRLPNRTPPRASVRPIPVGCNNIASRPHHLPPPSPAHSTTHNVARPPAPDLSTSPQHPETPRSRLYDPKGRPAVSLDIGWLAANTPRPPTHHLPTSPAATQRLHNVGRACRRARPISCAARPSPPPSSRSLPPLGPTPRVEPPSSAWPPTSPVGRRARRPGTAAHKHRHRFQPAASPTTPPAPNDSIT